MSKTQAELQEHMDAIVRMYEEQDGLERAEPEIYEPVVQTRPAFINIHPTARIDSFVKLEGGEGLRIGRYVHIASFAHLGIGGGETLVDDYAAVASHGMIISGSNQPDALSMSACAPKDIQRIKKARTVVSRYAVVLAGAVVGPGVTLHEGAVLAAGAVTMRDVPAWEIWAGVPARFLRKRSVKTDAKEGLPLGPQASPVGGEGASLRRPRSSHE
jgi:acetyltransferase-like isoleucine patch superfamily enzyme